VGVSAMEIHNSVHVKALAAIETSAPVAKPRGGNASTTNRPRTI
jgi:hypothetical protein